MSEVKGSSGANSWIGFNLPLSWFPSGWQWSVFCLLPMPEADRG